MTLRPIVRCLVVPILGLSLTPAATHPTEGAPAEPAAKVVNINQATTFSLLWLPGVGELLAERIVNHRSQHGAFRRPEDLMQIKGIGERFFAGLRPYVAVIGPTTLTEKVRVRA